MENFSGYRHDSFSCSRRRLLFQQFVQSVADFFGLPAFLEPYVLANLRYWNFHYDIVVCKYPLVKKEREKMKELNAFQIQFMKSVADIQKQSVASALYGKQDRILREEELYALTSEVIYRMMELLDGYGNHSAMGKLDIICGKTGERLKEKPFIELHDVVCDYIKE